MNLLYALLIISVVLNIIFFFQARNWNINFTEEFRKNDFSDEEHVNVEVARKGRILTLTIVTPSQDFFFNVTHDLHGDAETKKEDKTK